MFTPFFAISINVFILICYLYLSCNQVIFILNSFYIFKNLNLRISVVLRKSTHLVHVLGTVPASMQHRMIYYRIESILGKTIPNILKRFLFN